MRQFVPRIARSLLEISYVPRCVACGLVTSGNYLCEDCFNDIHFIFGEVTTSVKTHYSRMFAIAAYEGPMLEVIHKFKYAKGRAAHRVIENLIRSAVFRFDDIDCITYVPLHWRRYIKRSYNQSFEIARMISRLIKRPVLGRAVVKNIHTRPQVGMSINDRKKNLVGAFGRPRFLASSLVAKNVLLVDDVVTSGATVDECARIMVRSGAQRVDVLTLAKTL